MELVDPTNFVLYNLVNFLNLFLLHVFSGIYNRIWLSCYSFIVTMTFSSF